MQYLLLLLPLFISISQAFKPVQVQFNDLIHQSIDENKRVISGLSELGLITVSDIPGYKALREDILLASHHCLNANKDSAFLLELQDGTKRYTMASSSKSGFSEFGGVDTSREECAEFSKLYKNFNGLVDQVVDKFTTLLDRSLLDTEKNTEVMLDTESNEHSYSISDVVSKGTHLEHFHTYKKSTTLRDLYATDYARRLHKDQGLFIVMTPAFTFDQTESNDHGFFVELNNGEIVQPDFGTDGNQLVIMIGDGFVQWLNPKLKEKLVATKHAVSMPYSTAQTSKRSWYGRMILPKDSMFLEPQQQTYAEMEQSIKSNTDLHEYSVCSKGMVLNPRTLQSCESNELECWRDCFEITCGDNEEALCGSLSGDDFVECGDTEHGPQCQPTCVLQQTNVRPVVGNDFCNGIIVSMYMNGFSGVKDRREGCLVFLFPELVLDSAAKYFLASVVTVFIGIITEGIAYLRRKVARTVKPKKRKNMQRIALYSLQVLFGYIAMLIAMTYSLFLFFMIVLGLTIGHRIFNFDVKPGEFRDACCVDEEPTNEVSPEHYQK